MAQLSMAILDKDKHYMESLARYITLNYGLSFSVCCFSTIESFLDESGKALKKYDIALVSSNVCKTGLPEFPGTVIFLEDRLVSGEKEAPSIFKYRHCDSIIGKVLEIRSAEGETCCILEGNAGSARVVGVYSPVGGSGKSTIAAGLSVQCAGRGKKVFYLNLESACSTGSFFSEAKVPNISRILLSFKYDRETCARAIINTRVVSEISGLDYYLPPESSVEWEQMAPKDYEFMVGCLRDSGIYDYLFIDMDSAINRKTLATLRECDVVLLPTVGGNVAAEKMKALHRDISLLEPGERKLFESRIVAIENKYQEDNGLGCGKEVMPGVRIKANIPYSKAVEEARGSDVFFIKRNNFAEALREIASAYVMINDGKESVERL